MISSLGRLMSQVDSLVLSDVISLSVAICALNEANNIENTFLSVLAAAKSLPNIDLEIIIVNDGSTDETGQIAAKISNEHANVRLINNQRNEGLGASIGRAIQLATKDKFLFVPGDNDIPIATLRFLFQNANTADLVMTYFLNNELRGIARYILSSVFKLIYSLTFDLYLIYLNGPAVYPTDSLKKMRLYSSRFSIVAEINIRLLRQGCSFIELASNRQVGMDGSTSASFKSLFEVIKVYFLLIKEIFFTNKDRYKKRPIRVPIESIKLPTIL
jgi:glycosyltransferase involved in cell wall biosynthesis